MRINMFRITDHNLIIVTLGSDYGDTILRTGLPYEVDRIGIDTGNGMSKRGQGGGEEVERGIHLIGGDSAQSVVH